jgi:hypothetical protein
MKKVNLIYINLYNSMYNLYIQFILINWFLKWQEKCNSLYNWEEPDRDLQDTTYWRECGVYNQKI